MSNCLRPGDIIVWKNRPHRYRFWQVTGVYFGAVGQESVVGLRPMDRQIPTAHGEDIPEMLVPECMVNVLAYRQMGESA